MLHELGIKVQKYELDKLLEKHDRHKDGRLTKDEFEDVKNVKFS